MDRDDERHARGGPEAGTGRRARLFVALLVLSSVGSGVAVVATVSEPWGYRAAPEQGPTLERRVGTQDVVAVASADVRHP